MVSRQIQTILMEYHSAVEHTASNVPENLKPD